MMNNIRKRITCKLHSKTGETIGETLVALLIAALALVMLAGAISATAKVITTSDKKMGQYYDKDAGLVAQTGGTESKNVTIKGAGETIPAQETRSVKIYTNDAFTSKPVVAYKTDKTVTAP